MNGTLIIEAEAEDLQDEALDRDGGPRVCATVPLLCCRSPNLADA